VSWRDDALQTRGRIEALAELAEWLRAGRQVLLREIADHVQWMMHEAEHALRAPDRGPATSKSAARSMSVRVGSLRHRALVTYLGGGRTDEEVGDLIGHPRIWPRCSELRTMGLIAETDEVRRCARTGQDVAVSAITEAGRTMIASTRKEP